jgi:hypothetical protein
MDQVKAYSSKAEDFLETISQPLKPHIPAIARFLIVVTFLEDALRILFQWVDQVYYLEKIRGMPWGISHIFLAANIIVSKIISIL